MPTPPPHLQKSTTQAHLESCTYEQIVSHLDWELELNGLKAPDELQVNTVTQQATQQNSEKPKPTCHHCKMPGHYRNQCRQLKQEKDQARNNTNSDDKNNNIFGSGQTNSNSNNKVYNITNSSITNNEKDRRPTPVYAACETCVKTNHSKENSYFGANAGNRPAPWSRRPEGQNQVEQRNAQSNSNGNFRAAASTLNWKYHVFTPELHVITADK